MFLHWLFFQREWIVPLSAYISSISIALLLNYSHNHYLLFLPVFFCIASKYIFTFHGQHVFNPSLFGVVAALLLGGGLFSSAPAYQRSEEHTSELQSHLNLVCRLLLEKKNTISYSQYRRV